MVLELYGAEDSIGRRKTMKLKSLINENNLVKNIK